MRLLLCVSFLAFAGLALACCFGTGKSITVATPPDSTPSAPVTYKQISSDEFVSEWERNPAAASEKYASVPIELTGKLKIVDDFWDAFHVTAIASNSTEFRVIVKSDRAKIGLKDCEPGKMFVARGRASGIVSNEPTITADEIALVP